MTNGLRARRNIAALWTILALSAVTMIWLFWRHPVITGLATIGILAVLGVSARLARSVDTDMNEMNNGNRSV